jgi:TRAP-type C4-dicarboxylate transport system permease large subunit
MRVVGRSFREARRSALDFTPPMGTTLFTSAAISREPIGAMVCELWSLYLVALTVLALMSCVPGFHPLLTSTEPAGATMASNP